MTWFKVDDSFYDHPKIFDAPDCAVALWTRSGSWSARNLTNGFVPTGITRRFCDDPDTAVKELLARRLWSRVKGGFQFHDWTEYQPTKEAVERDRKAAAERQRKAREKKKKQVGQGAVTEESRRDSRVTHADSHGVSHTTPSRPVPSSPEGTRTDTGSQSSSRRNARGNDDDSIDLQIVELLADRTGSEISALWATQVRQNILTGRDVRPGARMAYVVKAISERPHDFLPPADSQVGERPPIQAAPEWCGYCDPHDRRTELADGTVARCEMCHPLVRRTA